MHELLNYIDGIEDSVSRAFRLIEPRHAGIPDLCYHTLAVILRGFNDFAPGGLIEYASEKLQAVVSSDGIQILEESAGDIRLNFRGLVEPTYTAASYWSPFDKKRRTMTHRRKTVDEVELRRVLSYAYAFYALTHHGATRNLFSVVQYIATKAKRKRGVPVCYEDHVSREALRGWWCIPPSCQEQLFEETGVRSAVDRYVINSDVSTPDLERALGAALAQSSMPDIGNFARDFLQSFGAIIPQCSEELSREIMATQQYMREFLGSTLSAPQALFMLLTHVLYKQACPTSYVYTFPVRVENTCCVMTVGTAKMLDATKVMSLSRVTASIFAHPLMLDYKLLHHRTQRMIAVSKTLDDSMQPEELPQGSSLSFGVKRRLSDEIGGDFYDIAELSNGAVFCLVGDFPGHGLEAAFGMATVRAYARAAAFLCAGAPDVTLQHVNSLAFHQPPFSAEVFCGLADQRTGIIKYVAAGGLCLVSYNAESGKATTLEAGSPWVGADAAETFALASTKLEAGDILVIATDAAREMYQHAKGIERTTAGEAERWFRATVARLADRSAHEIACQLVKRITRWRSEVEHLHQDDMTVLVIKGAAADKSKSGMQN